MLQIQHVFGLFLGWPRGLRDRICTYVAAGWALGGAPCDPVFWIFVPAYYSTPNLQGLGWAGRCKMDLNKVALKKMCRDSGLYSSPALNDKLYLHYKVSTRAPFLRKILLYYVHSSTYKYKVSSEVSKRMESWRGINDFAWSAQWCIVLSWRQGIRRIQNLEEYTGLRVLWLEGNGLSKLEGMEAQTQMKTLYAHENLIEKIEGLDSFLEASRVSHTLPGTLAGGCAAAAFESLILRSVWLTRARIPSLVYVEVYC